MASEIRVDKITHTSGVGTITPSPTGVHISGIVTGTTFSGSGASLTSLPAANLTGTLPAISAANLTNVPAANITGTLPAISAANLTNVPAANITGTLPAISAANLTNIPAANVTGTLPAITAANLTNIPAANIVGVATAGFERTGGFDAGITNLDQWYVSSNFTGSVNPISSNLARYTTAGGYLGSGMSESSGTFTFPTTGFWKIDVEGTITRIEGGRQSRHAEINILATTNNSSYSTISQAQTGYFDNYDAGYRYIGCFSSVVFDCTDTSTHKIRFQTVVQDNDSQGCRWDTPYLKMAFIKLADT